MFRILTSSANMVQSNHAQRQPCIILTENAAYIEVLVLTIIYKPDWQVHKTMYLSFDIVYIYTDQ